MLVSGSSYKVRQSFKALIRFCCSGDVSANWTDSMTSWLYLGFLESQNIINKLFGKLYQVLYSEKNYLRQWMGFKWNYPDSLEIVSEQLNEICLITICICLPAL